MSEFEIEIVEEASIPMYTKYIAYYKQHGEVIFEGTIYARSDEEAEKQAKLFLQEL